MHEPLSSAAPSAIRRRPIQARNTKWAHAVAARLRRSGMRPNQISVFSVVCALLGAGALLGSGLGGAGPWGRAALLLLAAGGIQLRLLCNLFDGLVAVEGGLRTKTGEIYNELPDRVSNTLLLGAAGYACGGVTGAPELGWAAAALAVIVAYVRALGGQLGAAQQFCGPMAKQQRMFVLTLACVAAAGEALLRWPPRAMFGALGLILLGSAFTAARRTVRIARELESRP